MAAVDPVRSRVVVFFSHPVDVVAFIPRVSRSSAAKAVSLGVRARPLGRTVVDLELKNIES